MRHGNTYEVMPSQTMKALEFTPIWATADARGQSVACDGTRWLLRLTLSYATKTRLALRLANAYRVWKQILHAFGFLEF